MKTGKENFAIEKEITNYYLTDLAMVLHYQTFHYLSYCQHSILNHYASHETLPHQMSHRNQSLTLVHVLKEARGSISYWMRLQ